MKSKSHLTTVIILLGIFAAHLTSLKLNSYAQDRETGLARKEVQIREVTPIGWRRTINGWEHTENWPTRSHTNQLQRWIHVSHQHESPYVIATLEELKQLHPLLYAFSLLAFTLSVAWISSLRQAASQSRALPDQAALKFQSQSETAVAP